MLKRKKTEWDKIRPKVKEAFREVNILSCEVIHPETLRKLDCCKGQWTSAFAHVDKKRHLKEGEIEKVILACQPCHDVIEYFCDKNFGMTMREYVEWVISMRRVQPRSVL